MSDLHRAVQDEIATFTPPITPPFKTITARKRARDRRRLATGGAVLFAVALAAVAVPSLAGGADRLTADRPPAPYAEPGRTPPSQSVAGPAEELCSAVAEQYDGELVAAYPTTVQAVRDYMTTPPTMGYALPAPGPHETNPFPPSWSFERPDADAAACYVDAQFPAPGPAGVEKPNRALIMAADGATTFMARAGQKTALEPAPLPATPAAAGGATETAGGLVWTGATICLGDSACRSLRGEQAQRLDAVLDTAVPAPPDSGYCRAAGITYTIQFQHPTARTVPITVRTLCGPMEQGGEKYLLDQVGQDQVEATYQEAANPSDNSPRPSARITGLDVGQSTPVTLATPCGVPALLVDGLPYLATSYAAPGTNPPGWGTTQQGRLRRKTDNSVIFVADDSTVRIQFLEAPGRHLQACTEQ